MNYYNEIKKELINNENYKKIKDYSKNRNDLETYYKVGKLLADAGKHYGDGIIKNYALQLSTELGKGYTYTALSRMRQYYLLMQNIAALPQHLSWSHICELLPIKNKNELLYYANQTIKRNLGYRKLREIIKSNEYERLDDNTKLKLINQEDTNIADFIKNPIVIKNAYNYDANKEYVLRESIIEDLDNFLEQLGEGFCYKKKEYKIRIGNRFNYIDLLLYNTKYKCYVVIELKIRKLKHNDIGQLKYYMNYIDKKVKDISDNKTIGIILCKYDDKFVMEYCSDDRIFRTTYILTD